MEPVDAPAMLKSWRPVRTNGRDFPRGAGEILMDNVVDAAEARRMIRRVQALLSEGESLLAGLQANIEERR